ncbi:nucleoredoxin-like isoform X1 [Pecten maximus]|uniref:nucleoredoxin-like isoform X1 n=1 Tax=Pecten maximus TaxID=6579 RepID=UPI001458F010|nr:nucleoredoxin-like isoform X1 [Pecten maximus]
MAEGKICELLGKSLLKQNGDNFIQVDTDQSEGLGEKEYVGIYFSAHWCPPCRSFTPQLIQFYKEMKKAGANKFEVVFFSSDGDESSFKGYAKEMPWLYLPYTDRDRKNQLSKTFKVGGIPTLVLLEVKTGKLITRNGRQKVGTDPDGIMFPWSPKTYREILNGDGVSEKYQETFVKGDYLEKLEGKVFGLYFSAQWSPPCRAFTSQLVTKYTELKNDGKPFEIVFATADCSEDEYNDYRKKMPWLAFPYGDPRIQSFREEFNIEGFPALVLINVDWTLITTAGQHAIMESPIEEFPYKIGPVNPVSERFFDTLGNSRCLIYFTDPEDVQKSKEIMSGPANEYYKDGEEQKLYFFVGGNVDKGRLSGIFYNFLVGAEKRRCLLIADISKGTKYVAADDWTMSEGNIREFITKWRRRKSNPQLSNNNDNISSG